MQRKILSAIEYDEEGNKVYSANSNLMNENWIRAARLKRRADDGDEDAAKKLKEMENTDMVSFDDE